MITTTVTIDFSNTTALNPIKATQGDAKSRKVSLKLLNGGVPVNLTGCTVRVLILPFGQTTGLYEDCTITSAITGKVDYLMSGNACAIAGTGALVVEIIETGTPPLSLLYSKEVPLQITPKRDFSGAIMASTVFSALQSALATAGTYLSRIVALETADGQNVKLAGAQTLTGLKSVPTPVLGAHIVNKDYVDNKVLPPDTTTVKLDGAQTLTGLKSVPTPTLSAHITNKGYVDQITSANASAISANTVNINANTSAITSLASGSPKASYTTLSSLTAAFPSGNTNIYLVLADGKWYYWNGSAWLAGGIYQATGVADNSVGINHLKVMKWGELSIGSASLLFDTINKTVKLSANQYVSNDDGYVLALTGAPMSYGNDVNTTYICVNRATGVLFKQDIVTPTIAYAFILCRISIGKVYCPYGFKQILVNGVKVTGINADFEVPDKSISLGKLNFDMPTPANRPRLYSFADAWNSWKKGLKFPVGFIGDSTTESNATANPPDYNVLGTDHISVGSYCSLLESHIKTETGNSIARIYNAGFSSKNAVWSLANIDALIKTNTNYLDVKMLGIMHGINDPLVAVSADYIDSFKTAMRGLIDWCRFNNIQPFLVTPQSTMIAFPMYGSLGYTSAETTNISLSVIREMASEYNLELIDNYKYAKILQLGVNNVSSLIPDGLHFREEGHRYEADLLFSEFDKEVIKIDVASSIGYNNPETRSGIGSATLLSSKIAGFNSQLTTTASGVVFKVALFNCFKHGVVLNFMFVSSGNLTVNVNGTDYVLNSAAHEVTISGMGLIKIKVSNVSANNLTFYGVYVI